MVIALYTLCALLSFAFTRSYKFFNKYYPTLLYVSSFSVLYQLICRGHLLWHFRDWYFFTDKLSTLTQFTLLFPCVIILFLRYVDHRRKRTQALIYLGFVGLFVLMELLLWLSGEIVYAFGWNFGWSTFIDFCLFALAFVHSRNVRAALIISVCVTIFLILWFRIPMSG